jgi:ribosomal protein L11 methyltransferase
VVVANILAVTLRELAPQLARLVGLSGVLVLSGMLVDQGEAVDAAYAAVGLRLAASDTLDQWRSGCYVISAPR